MIDRTEQWQWADQDPIEAFLRQAQTAAVERAGLPKATSLYRDGKLHESLEVLREAIAAGENAAEIHAVMGHIQADLQEFESAVASYCKSLQRNPDLFEPLFGLAVTLLHVGKPQDALHGFERCLRVDPEHGGALFGEAVALQLLRRYEEAESSYQRLLHHSPDSEEALANVITMMMDWEKDEKVREYSERLLKMNPRSGAALQGLAALALASADYESAAEYCTKLIEVEPNSFAGRFNLRLALQRLGRPSVEESSADILPGAEATRSVA
jgi:tetratricopeptide (TPR) repeat protein